MLNEITCRFCVGADPRREKDGLIRCLKNHKFVQSDGTCQLHSELFPQDCKDAVEQLRKALKEGYNVG